jgi:Bacterial PH domain
MTTASTLASQQAHRVSMQKLLLPREEIRAMVRRHPVVLIVPTLQAVGGLLVAALLSVTVLQHQALLTDIAWLLCGLLILRLTWTAVNWYVDFFVVTSARIWLTSGVFTRSVNMMPLDKVTDMSFHKSFGGRLLGYGDFVVESAGKDSVLRRIDHIPYPEQLYQVVCLGAIKVPEPIKIDIVETPPDAEPDDEFELEPSDDEADDGYDDMYDYDDQPDQPVEF